MKHRDSRFTDCYKPNPELEAWLEQRRQKKALDDDDTGEIDMSGRDDPVAIVPPSPEPSP